MSIEESAKNNNLKNLRIRHGLTQQELGQQIGVQKAAVSKYERGVIAIPQKLIDTLCNIFDVTADELLGRSACDNTMTYTSILSDKIASVPLLGRVHAGEAMLADENIVEYIPLSTDQLSYGTYFYMEVEGDCMTGDSIPEGALVLVRQQNSVENGQIAVIRLENEVMLRHVKYESGYLVLAPSNPAYEPVIVTGGDVNIVGRVVEVRFKV